MLFVDWRQDAPPSSRHRGFAALLVNDGISPSNATPEQFGARIRNELEVWRKVVQQTGIKLE
jgi:tripartite-type tricarboxylate transporter receptor subunit TctC